MARKKSNNQLPLPLVPLEKLPPVGSHMVELEQSLLRLIGEIIMREMFHEVRSYNYKPDNISKFFLNFGDIATVEITLSAVVTKNTDYEEESST